MQILTLLSFLLLGSSTPKTVSLTITTSVASKGELHLAVYDSELGFQTREELLSFVRPTTGQTLSLELQLPAAGDYVLAAFHDLNGNGELDTNMFGVPTEPYGFSQAPPTKWREPEFKEIATSITSDGASATITLKKWKEY